jgi:hypothetical protein
VLVQCIQQLPPARIGQRFQHCIHLFDNMQPYGCMSSADFRPTSFNFGNVGADVRRL